MNSTGQPLISVVLSFRNEADNIPTLVSRLNAMFTSQHLEYELLFVNDASTDASLEILTAYAARDPRVKVVTMSRRFGPTECAIAGIRFAAGDAVILMDTDLQDPDASHADDNEQPLTSAADDPTAAATRPVPLAAGRETDGVAPERRARGPRSRIAIVAAGVIALVVGTAVYVGTRGTPEDQRGRRPTSTSLERQSASTGTPVTTASSDPAPDTEPALASNASPGSAAPASRQTAPKGTGSTQSGAPATPTAGVGPPPPAASNGPNASPPPPPPTPAPSTSPNPVCQITPQLCP